MITTDAIRACFPALAGPTIYLENAGGSQVPRVVADAMHEYMTGTYVQLGAPYDVSRRSTEVVDQAHIWINRFMGGEEVGEVALGPSCTQLVTMLAECYSRHLRPGDEIIFCQTAHEANYGPWLKLERFGLVINPWPIDPETGVASLEALRSLFTARTRLVCFPHVSNLLGEVVDVAAITQLAHEHGAEVVVDGVAFAPHRLMDVRAWGVDWYIYSTYKVFGPHMAALFGRHEAWEKLEGPNHFFIPNQGTYKFELGGASHEGCAGLLALGDYLRFVAGEPGEAMPERSTVATAMNRLAAMELPVQQALIQGLRRLPGIRIVGPDSFGPERVPTVSFLHNRLSPAEICAHTDAAGIGIRYGHMYAYRLCLAMGIGVEEGVVRVSAAHYNTVDEVERLIGVFRGAMRA
ncbi:MAG: cysteine desulfurase-like protein [Fimbriimonadaceae bacterium]|nr:cysteine desulfurase-like protein [Fimbriimonadaceae bacterium]